ncbi:MAG: MerR family transcriptional regulator [Gaiellaceae bacterium]
MDRTYTIKQAAAETGVTAHTLRYYERIGLLEPITREPSGRRRYSEANVYSVRFLTMLRATGMPIRDMLVFMRLTRAGDETVSERAELLERHQRELSSRLKELAGHMEALEHKIAFYRQRERELEAAGQEARALSSVG